MSQKTILVTGASSGLGAHFAAVLARDGARVILAARSEGKIADQVGAIRDAGGTAIKKGARFTQAPCISKEIGYSTAATAAAT